MFHGLYAITPACDDTALLITQVTQALKGGIQLLQYRAKHLSQEQRVQQASALLELCRNYSCPLIINDDPVLAKKIKAQGVHLGQGDDHPAHARELLGKNAIIGITCHNSLHLAHEAQLATADYLAFGAFFPSTTKVLAQTVPLSLLSEAKSLFNLPIVAIGGITLAHAPALIHAGADMLAVIHALFTSDDIQAQCHQFQQLFTPSLTTTPLDSK